MIFVDETIENESAGTPPKLTEVTPVKPLPVILTTSSFLAVAGVKEKMARGDTVFLKTETDPDLLLADTISGIPSPSRSAVSASHGFDPTI